ncbi:MAG: hypothetical protein RIR11_4297 [Bacteroidota bacterium]|jgi:hypothetical protein
MRHLYILFFLLPITTYAQKHDCHWAFGYGYILPDDTISEGGNCLVDFNLGHPQFTKTNLKLRFDSHTAVCSDSLGQLLFYTNGLRVLNQSRQLIENGDTINPGTQWQNAVEDNSGYSGFSPLALPDPAGGNRYYLIHIGIKVSNGIKFSPLYYTTIDMAANNGAGKVTKKNQILAEGSFSEAVAAKHANGRDWWVIVHVADQPRFLRYLITPEGLSEAAEQTVTGLNFANFNGPCRARMSYNGQQYAFINDNNFTALYDFDRCSGFLSNQRVLLHNPDFFFNFLIFSPDSRFLYLNRTRTILQYDLMADTLAGYILDTVQRFDFNVYPFEPFGANYAESAIGADGKIYYTPFSSTRFLAPMHRPNLAGSACDMENSGIFLPRYIGYTYHHYPNYRLGRLAGSPCDTLPMRPSSVAVGFEPATQYEDFLEQQTRSSRQVFQQPPPIQGTKGCNVGETLQAILEERLKERAISEQRKIHKSTIPK